MPSAPESASAQQTAATSPRCPRESAAKPRPPSSCQIGIRLKTLIQAPMRAIVKKIGLWSAAPSASAARAAAAPHTGPARPTRASSPTVAGCCLSRTNAPKPGMNMGAVAAMPYRRSQTTCPISWT